MNLMCYVVGNGKKDTISMKNYLRQVSWESWVMRDHHPTLLTYASLTQNQERNECRIWTTCGLKGRLQRENVQGCPVFDQRVTNVTKV